MPHHEDPEEISIDCPVCHRSFSTFARLDDNLSEHEGRGNCGQTIRGPLPPLLNSRVRISAAAYGPAEKLQNCLRRPLHQSFLQRFRGLRQLRKRSYTVLNRRELRTTSHRGLLACPVSGRFELNEKKAGQNRLARLYRHNYISNSQPRPSGQASPIHRCLRLPAIRSEDRGVEAGVGTGAAIVRLGARVDLAIVCCGD
jgi:hypothetical protein